MSNSHTLAFLLFLQTASSATTSAPTFAGGSRTGTPFTRPTDFNGIPISSTPSGAGEPVFPSFLSYSLELAFFPDFAGDLASPNTFSGTLLSNLGALQGANPDIRVGGNTQDYALYDASLKTATNATYIPSISNDYPRVLTLGPKFFESYQALPDTSFIHGFNLAKNGSDANAAASAEAAIACKYLSLNGSFKAWEMGNEPDLFKTSAQGIMRPGSWNEADFVKEWDARVDLVKKSLEKNCGKEWTENANWKWIAPSFAGTGNSLDALKTWKAGLNKREEVVAFSSHNYIGGATQPGVNLKGFLLSHSKTVGSVGNHVREQASLKAANSSLPYILGETNSLYNQGAAGLSNSFGAALWNLDFALQCAATSIRQIYMHMGTDYRYASWQPVTTSKSRIGTRAPYYGNIATVAALGDVTTDGGVRVKEVKLKSGKDSEAAYAIYTSSKLSRVVVINMAQYNYTSPSQTLSNRPKDSYNFTLPTGCAGQGVVQRLMANGSDATSGITFNGESYAYELEKGRPVRLGNTTRDEVVYVGSDGGMGVEVPWSSAAVVVVDC
ncbi:hypothetical protein BCR34DRAFT_548540 [Clohesyomyces aquaticus]|uniref:Beta-glucuronidase C-terminal domain-containing protein n=1 Tax=Clohesyomyces aquaticus TaxID=1231657 RepID=A0A1Y1YHV6_9PLEO|nr:hypothetical protein BCR34DRAFT_548540 [Clohesyomyces aquaticus]